MKKTLIAGASALALVASLFVSVAPAAQAALNVPKSAWPVCSQSRTIYCVDSVSVTTVNGKTIALTWVADGATLNPVDTATVTADSSTVTLDSNTVTTPIVSIPTLSTGRG